MKTIRALIQVGLVISMAAFSAVPCDAVTWKESTLKAQAAIKTGDLGKAMAYARLAAEQATSTFGKASLNASKATELLGDVNWAGGNAGEARRLYRKALILRERLFAAPCTACTRLILKMAGLELAEGRLDKAESLFRKVAYSSSEANTRNDPWVAVALVGVGKIHLINGDYASAHTALDRAQTIYSTVGKYDATSALKVADIKEKQGDVYKREGDYGRAAKSYQEALHALKEAGVSSGLRAATTHLRLADTYVRWAKPARALRQFRKALAIERRETGSMGLLAGATLTQMGGLQRERGNRDTAESLYRAAVVALRDCSPEGCPLMASAEQSLANLSPQGSIRAGSVSGDPSTEVKQAHGSEDRRAVRPGDGT